MTEDLSEDLARRWVETVDGQLPEGLVEMNADPYCTRSKRLGRVKMKTNANLAN